MAISNTSASTTSSQITVATITGTADELALLTAHAKLTGTTPDALVSISGKSSAIQQAIQQETQREVSEGSVGADIQALMAKDQNLVWQAAWSSYNSGTIPASLLTAIAARAAKQPN